MPPVLRGNRNRGPSVVFTKDKIKAPTLKVYCPADPPDPLVSVSRPLSVSSMRGTRSGPAWGGPADSIVPVPPPDLGPIGGLGRKTTGPDMDRGPDVQDRGRPPTRFVLKTLTRTSLDSSKSDTSDVWTNPRSRDPSLGVRRPRSEMYRSSNPETDLVRFRSDRVDVTDGTTLRCPRSRPGRDGRPSVRGRVATASVSACLPKSCRDDPFPQPGTLANDGGPLPSPVARSGVVPFQTPVHPLVVSGLRPHRQDRLHRRSPEVEVPSRCRIPAGYPHPPGPGLSPSP